MTATEIVLNVEGIPGPKGSKTPARNRFGMRESSKKVKPWEEAVHRVASAEVDRLALFEPLEGAYKIDVWFFFRRPRTSKFKQPTALYVGDIDKLLRATFDPLVQSGLLSDDAEVVTGEQGKEWAGPGESPGAIIRITPRVEAYSFRPLFVQQIIDARLGDEKENA